MRSVAKGRYIKGEGGIKHALAHVRYLQLRGGEDRDCAEGRRRQFINATRENINGWEVNKRIRELNEDNVIIHRIVLSPGVEGVDMDAYTRYVMRELEHSRGQTLTYFATTHRNTNHTHAHLVILGTKDGKEVRLNRKHYTTIREAGDRYLERYHHYERYQDREIHDLMQRGYERDRGDSHFERMLFDINSNLSLEELEKQKELTERLVKEEAIRNLPDEEIINCEAGQFTKYSKLNELLDLDQKLRDGEYPYIPKEEYKKIWTWIGNKKQFGDKYYEETAEADRIFKEIHENLKQALSAEYSPAKNFTQYVHESRGRMLDWHGQFSGVTEKDRLEKEISLLEKSPEENSEQLEILREQLEWLKDLANERNPLLQDKSAPVSLQSLEDIAKRMNGNLAKHWHFDRSFKFDQINEEKWRKVYGDLPIDLFHSASGEEKIAIHRAIYRATKNENSQLHDGSFENNERLPDSENEIDRDQDHPDVLDEFEDHINLNQSIENNWNLDQKISGEDDIHKIIFGKKTPLEAPPNSEQIHENSNQEFETDGNRFESPDAVQNQQSEQHHQKIDSDAILENLDNWRKIAFETDHEQNLSPQEQEHFIQQMMEQLVQQQLKDQIKRTFDPERQNLTDRSKSDHRAFDPERQNLRDRSEPNQQAFITASEVDKTKLTDTGLPDRTKEDRDDEPERGR